MNYKQNIAKSAPMAKAIVTPANTASAVFSTPAAPGRIAWPVIESQVGKPDQLLAIMLLGVGRLRRMAAGIALFRGKPLGGELRQDRAHADFGIDQNLRRIGCDLLPLALDRQRPLPESVAERGRSSIRPPLIVHLEKQPAPGA